MKTTTMYFARIEVRKNYWVSSKGYPTASELLAAMADYVSKSTNLNVRFYTQETIVQA